MVQEQEALAWRQCLRGTRGHRHWPADRAVGGRSEQNRLLVKGLVGAAQKSRLLAGWLVGAAGGVVC